MARHPFSVCLQVCVAAQLHLHFTLCTFLAQRPRRQKKKGVLLQDEGLSSHRRYRQQGRRGRPRGASRRDDSCRRFGTRPIRPDIAFIGSVLSSSVRSCRTQTRHARRRLAFDAAKQIAEERMEQRIAEYCVCMTYQEQFSESIAEQIVDVSVAQTVIVQVHAEHGKDGTCHVATC